MLIKHLILTAAKVLHLSAQMHAIGAYDLLLLKKLFLT